MCGNYSREETIQGRKLYVEIRYIKAFKMMFVEDEKKEKTEKKKELNPVFTI